MKIQKVCKNFENSKVAVNHSGNSEAETGSWDIALKSEFLVKS